MEALLIFEPSISLVSLQLVFKKVGKQDDFPSVTHLVSNQDKNQEGIK